MSLGKPDFHIVHEDPYPLALGSDPKGYLSDFMKPFSFIVNLTHIAGYEPPETPS